MSVPREVLPNPLRHPDTLRFSQPEAHSPGSPTAPRPSRAALGAEDITTSPHLQLNPHKGTSAPDILNININRKHTYYTFRKHTVVQHLQILPAVWYLASK